MELVTIPFSHFNERARWALNHFGQDPAERRYLPMFHLWGVGSATRWKRGPADSTSSPFSTPVLLAESDVVRDSGDIVRWADDEYGDPGTTLYPAEHRDDILTFEQEVHDRLGAHTRRLAYFMLMSEPAGMFEMFRLSVGAAQGAAFRVCFPIVSRVLKDRLRINEHAAEESRERIRSAFDDFDQRIGDREFLFGNRFSAADLTLAALASPVLQPIENFGAPMPAPQLLPRARKHAEEFRSTTTGRHALRMFEHHRRLPHRRT